MSEAVKQYKVLCCNVSWANERQCEPTVNAVSKGATHENDNGYIAISITPTTQKHKEAHHVRMSKYHR